MDLNTNQISLDSEQGSSLVAVLIIITIILFLIGTIFLGISIQGRFIQRDINKVKARYIAEAGMYQFLANSSAPGSFDIDSLQVQVMDSTATASVDAHPFGGFLTVTSTANVGSISRSVRAMVGQQADSVFGYSVIIGDLHSPLNLAGSTNIRGDVVVGPSGIRKSSFRGRTYKGSIDGKVFKSSTQLFPEFNNVLYSKETSTCDSLIEIPPSNAITINTEQMDLARMDITEQRRVFYVDGNIKVTSRNKILLPEKFTVIATGDLTIDGDIIYQPLSRFIAGKNLTIAGNVKGEHAIFYAKQILTAKGKNAYGGQFLAQKKVDITKGAYLKYPSVVYLKGVTHKGIRKGRIEVSQKSIIDGTLMIPSPEMVVNNDETILVVNNGTKIRGAIYNTSQTELHGSIIGSILTLQFYFYESPTAYINWLKDTEIDIKNRPDHYVTPLGFSERNKYQIIDWQEL